MYSNKFMLSVAMVVEEGATLFSISGPISLCIKSKCHILYKAHTASRPYTLGIW